MSLKSIITSALGLMIVIRKPLGLESDTGASNWVVYPVQDSHLGPFISYCHYTESYNGHRKAPCALYQEYEGQTGSNTRYKSVIMGIVSVITLILSRIMSKTKPPMRYTGHMTVKLGLI